MQAFGPFLSGFCNAGPQVWNHVIGKTLACLARDAAEKAAFDRAEQVTERGARVRQTFLDSIGGLPQTDAPLNARVLSTIPRNGFRLEKVVYESLPNYPVTSLLYVPEGLTGPAPAILFVSGHDRQAKCSDQYQRVCIDFALNGFVVFAIDPIGQGERVSHFNPDTGEMPIGWGTSEHGYQGVQCVLTGTSIARYFLWDALRALDYLETRPEVDRARIGVTGNSGGGTQTTLLCMSGDPRIAAAAPCTYVTAREDYILTGQPQDAEQIQFGISRDGINYDDMFLPIAPRPLLLGAVEWDFFPPEGTHRTAERLKRLYTLLGAKQNVAHVFAPGGHMYCRELRQAVGDWFMLHLTRDGRVFQSRFDDAIEVLPEQELWCTSKGHVRTDSPGALTPYHLNVAAIPSRSPAATPEDLRARMLDALLIRDRVENQVGLFPRVIATQNDQGIEAQSVYFISESNIMVSGCLMRREGASPAACTLYLTDDGTSAIDALLPELQEKLTDQMAAFVFDVRGRGAVQATPVSNYGTDYPSTMLNTEGWTAYVAYCVGECLLGMRVFDVLRGFEYLRKHAGYASIGIDARGLQPALWGYLAAAIDGGVNPVRAAELIPSFEAVVRQEFYRTDFTPALAVHGVLRQFDLPDLVSLFASRDVRVESADLAFA